MLPAAGRRTILAGALLAVASHAWGQAAGRLPHVGFCSPGIPGAALVDLEHPIPRALLAGMRERGWVHGGNYRMTFRSAVGRPGGMPACIDSLVAEPVDVIVTPGGLRRIVERAGRIPVVTTISDNDVAFVESVPASRRTFTGVRFTDNEALWHKQLTLFKELAKVDRIVALLARQPSPEITPGLQKRALEPQADELAAAVRIDTWIVTSFEQVEAACAAIARLGASACSSGTTRSG